MTSAKLRATCGVREVHEAKKRGVELSTIRTVEVFLSAVVTRNPNFPRPHYEFCWSTIENLSIVLVLQSCLSCLYPHHGLVWFAMRATAPKMAQGQDAGGRSSFGNRPCQGRKEHGGEPHDCGSSPERFGSCLPHGFRERPEAHARRELRDSSSGALVVRT